jgi:hypothetical protein
LNQIRSGLQSEKTDCVQDCDNNPAIADRISFRPIKHSDEHETFEKPLNIITESTSKENNEIWLNLEKFDA